MHILCALILFFSLGILKTECHNIQRVKCIGACPALNLCDSNCKKLGYTSGECYGQPYNCCCFLN